MAGRGDGERARPPGDERRKKQRLVRALGRGDRHVDRGSRGQVDEGLAEAGDRSPGLGPRRHGRLTGDKLRGGDERCVQG
jgi:hypothetical protein